MRDIQKEKNHQYNESRDTFLEGIVAGKGARHVADYFPKYAHRNELSYFLARHEIFKKILGTRGCIVECGVAEGAGLLTWAQLSAVQEPLGVWRHIYGFDTFEGFPSVHENDLKGAHNLSWKTGDISHETHGELLRCLEMLDRNPYPPHFPKVELIRGNFLETGEKFLHDNPHILISLLYMDFDLYEPTKRALELFVPRMPKGSVIAFDELNHHRWPGETRAFLDVMSIRDIEIKTIPYMERISYAIL